MRLTYIAMQKRITNKLRPNRETQAKPAALDQTNSTGHNGRRRDSCQSQNHKARATRALWGLHCIHCCTDLIDSMYQYKT